MGVQETAGERISANEAVVGIIRTSEAFVALANRALGSYRLSAAGRQALAVLDGAGEPLSPTEIARRLIVTTATVTTVLDTLERRGLIERRPDPDDRRRLLVAVTPAGSELVSSFVPEVVALQAQIMAGVSEAERRRLIAVLTRIRDAIESVDLNKGDSDGHPRIAAAGADGPPARRLPDLPGVVRGRRARGSGSTR